MDVFLPETVKEIQNPQGHTAEINVFGLMHKRSTIYVLEVSYRAVLNFFDWYRCMDTSAIYELARFSKILFNALSVATAIEVRANRSI